MEYTLKEEIQDKFLQISESISIIEERCKNIQNHDFLLSLGEWTIQTHALNPSNRVKTIKAVDDKHKELLQDYPQIPWAWLLD